MVCGKHKVQAEHVNGVPALVGDDSIILVVYHQHLLALALTLITLALPRVSLASSSTARLYLALAPIQLLLPVVYWPQIPVEALEHLCEDAARLSKVADGCAEDRGTEDRECGLSCRKAHRAGDRGMGVAHQREYASAENRT